jgi:hypothetical protein
MFPWLEFGVLVVMLVGLLGLIVPLFPGIFVIWLGTLIFGLFHGFNWLGVVLFILLTLLMIIGEVMDNLMMGASARKAGVPWSTIGLAFFAGVVGTFVFPPIGGVVAAPAVVALLEYRRVHEWRKAIGILWSLALGWGLAIVVKLGIGGVMFALWGLWVWKG